MPRSSHRPTPTVRILSSTLRTASTRHRNYSTRMHLNLTATHKRPRRINRNLNETHTIQILQVNGQQSQRRRRHRLRQTPQTILPRISQIRHRLLATATLRHMSTPSTLTNRQAIYRTGNLRHVQVNRRRLRTHTRTLRHNHTPVGNFLNQDIMTLSLLTSTNTLITSPHNMIISRHPRHLFRLTLIRINRQRRIRPTPLSRLLRHKTILKFRTEHLNSQRLTSQSSLNTRLSNTHQIIIKHLNIDNCAITCNRLRTSPMSRPRIITLKIISCSIITQTTRRRKHPFHFTQTLRTRLKLGRPNTITIHLKLTLIISRRRHSRTLTLHINTRNALGTSLLLHIKHSQPSSTILRHRHRRPTT